MFVFSSLVELSNIHVKRQERDPLISLPNVLCLIINDINRRSGGYGASMDEIKTTLKLHYPEFPLPTDDILYSTIGTLIQDKILLLKSKIHFSRILIYSFFQMVVIQRYHVNKLNKLKHNLSQKIINFIQVKKTNFFDF